MLSTSQYSGRSPQGGGNGSAQASSLDLSDTELLDKARKSDPEFGPLFDGDTGGRDHSGAHMALMNKLAFWTGRDAPRMERLFSASKLGEHPKWSRPDYRARTIKRAIADCQTVYTPRFSARSIPSTNGKARSAPGPIVSGKGLQLSCLHNSVLWLEEHVDAIRFDAFHQTIAIGGEILTDEMIIGMQRRIESDTGSPWSLEPVRNAVTLIAHHNAFNSLTDWLDGLKWDGVERLGYFFGDTFNVPKNGFTAFASKVFFLGAVARAYKPGCKVDTMPVLIGAQGILKSSTFRALVPEERLFTDDLGADLFDKKPGEGLRGKWIIEFSEFARINRSTSDVVKSFLSRQSDHYRPPYGRFAKDFPRTCVFVGTTNNHQPLHDDENRRFLPVVCGAPENPVSYARDNRDQLWAEAVHRYHQGEQWWTDDPKILEAAREAQDLARAPDVWEEILEQELRCKSSVTMHEAVEMLHLPIDRCDKSVQTRIGLILRSLGFTRKTRPRSGESSRPAAWHRA